MGSSYRVNRRKSSFSASGVNMAALAAAVNDASLDHLTQRVQNRPVSSNDGGRLLAESHVSTARGPLHTPPLESWSNVDLKTRSSEMLEGPPLSSLLSLDRSANRIKARRASEGSRLTRGERRRSANGELRCETCGKGYKHGSCLTKHLLVPFNVFLTLLNIHPNIVFFWVLIMNVHRLTLFSQLGAHSRVEHNLQASDI